MAREKSAIADFNCYYKMTSAMALDGAMPFLSLKKTLQIQVNVCDTVQLLVGMCSAMADSWKTLKPSNVFSSFIVYLNRNRSTLLRELMSNNLLLELIFFLIMSRRLMN